MDSDTIAPPAQTAGRQPVFEFDLFDDPRFSSEGSHHAYLRRLNEAPEVFWTPRQGGHWVIRSHALAFEAAQSTDLFSSRRMNIPKDETEMSRKAAIPIMLDPPEHAKYREPLARVFGPQRMAKLEGKIRKMAIELIEAVREKGRCDFVKDLAEPLPVFTFMNMMGMDTSRLREFRELAIVGSVDPDPDTRRAASGRVFQIMSDFVEARRAAGDTGADDVTAAMLRIEIDGEPISTDDLKAYFQLLFFAGLDTVVNAMSFAINYLARNPALQARCREDIGNVKLIAEELLRLGGPAAIGRCVTRDVEWHGVAMKQGDMVLLELPAANLDASVFPDPLTCNPDRQSIAHLTFNSGPHRCIGQHLARIELRVMYEEWLTRIPEFRPDPEAPPAMHGGLVMGVDTLPLVWEA